MGAEILMTDKDDFQKQYKLAREDLRKLVRGWGDRDAEPLITLTVAMVLLSSSAYALFDTEEDADRFLAETLRRGKALYNEVEGDSDYVH